MRRVRPGIVICSRLTSSRVPRKALLEINGLTVLEHLIRRLRHVGIPIYVAVPGHELGEYSRVLGRYIADESFGLILLAGEEEDPLARMDFVATMMGLDTIIRVTHDKIFVDENDIRDALEVFDNSELDYVYSSSFIPGTGFEIIDAAILREAACRFKNVEHISYAVKAVTNRKSDVPMGHPRSCIRLLIDYPEDVALMSEIFYHLGNDCSNYDVVKFLCNNPKIRAINSLPDVTVYTCAYNAEKWLPEAIQSVFRQSVGHTSEVEYLLIDDGSKDSTLSIMQDVAQRFTNVRYLANFENRGLSSSSNRALSQARGKYIIRLDADDFFTDTESLREMLLSMNSHDFDVMYPDHYLGSMLKIEKGNVHHHAGGAIFRTQALNHMKFTDGLRGFEGYDLYERAKTQLKIGYFERPTFFYRQHDKSLTKEDPAKRAEIKKEIDARVTQRN